MQSGRISWMLATLTLAILVLSGCGTEQETIPTPALRLATPTAGGDAIVFPTQIVVVIVTPTPGEAGEGAAALAAQAGPAAEEGTPAEGEAQAAAAPQMGEEQLISTGEEVYAANCASCHQTSGEGTSTYPALIQSTLLTAQDPTQAIQIVLHGRGQMPAFEDVLSSEQIAVVLSYERNSWDNNATVVTVAQVEAVQEGGATAQAAQTATVTGTVTATAAPAATTTVTATATVTTTATVTATNATTVTSQTMPSPRAATTATVETTTPVATTTMPETEITTPTAELPGAAGGTAPPPTWTPAPVVTQTLATPTRGTPSGATPSATGTPQPQVTQAAQAAGNDQQLISQGEEIYASNCASCHQASGEGTAAYPALTQSELLTAEDPTEAIEIVLHGRGQMPAFEGTLSPEEIAAVLSYERNSWDNNATVVTVAQVEAVQQGGMAAQASQAVTAIGTVTTSAMPTTTITGTPTVTATGTVNGAEAITPTDTSTMTGTGTITPAVTGTGTPAGPGTPTMTTTATVTATTTTATGATTGTAAQATPTPTRLPLPTPRATYQARQAEVTPSPTATEAAPLGAQAQVTPENGNWPTFGYNYEQTRHVPLFQITRENVRDLGRVWSVDFQSIDQSIPGGQESYPLVISDTLYATTSFNHVFALDAASGEVKWHFSPGEIGKFQNFGLNVNRGLGYCDGVLYMLTLDMRIMAIDAATGELVQEVNTADTIPEARAEYGYYQTHAPICYDGILVIGSSGGDNGVRGFVMAYNAADLTPAWPNPYWTIPPADQDWRSQGRFHGGGAVWMSPTIDTQTEMLYFSVGNPSPDFFPQLRPGDNPKTNSVVAVDLRTGEEQWWQQQLAGDQWDYDTGQPPMVYTARVDGELRRVVSVGTKEGRWFAYDAETGEPIYEGVAVLDTIDHPTLEPGEPVAIFPSALGGINYAPQSYDPATNYAFVVVVESKTILIQARSAEEVDEGRARGDVDTGAINSFGTNPAGWHDYGSISAIDLNTGEVVWKVNTAEPERGGVTTTATGLGFAGGGDGYLRAFDTATGAILWQFQTGAPIAAAPTIYAVDGIQYVAVTVGGTSTSSGGGKISQLHVFALGGDPMQFALPGVESGGQTEEEIQAQAQQEQPEPAQFIALDEQEENKINLTVSAAFDATNGGLNFNGYADGNAVYRIPQGATVEVTFKNLSTQSPHSVLIVPDGAQDQVRMPAPVFDGASTPDPESGITSGSQVFTFTATEQGRFVMACGVPGHAQAGHWIWFEVGPPDSQPSYQPGDQEPYIPGSAGNGGTEEGE